MSQAPSNKKWKTISIRLEAEQYDIFAKLCHLKFKPMAEISRKLLVDWTEKNKKSLEKMKA